MKSSWPTGKQIHYVLDLHVSFERGTPVLAVGHRSRKKNGEWGSLQFPRLARDDVPMLPAPTDRRILAGLAGAPESASGYWGRPSSRDSLLTRYEISETLFEAVIPDVCRTGRAWLQAAEGDRDLFPLEWDDGESWEFRVEIVRSKLHYGLSFPAATNSVASSSS